MITSRIKSIKFMNKPEYTRKSSTVLAASALSSIVSTAISNPIEVAKLNLQFFPLSCQYYPHQSFRQLISCNCSRFSMQGSLQSLKLALPQVLFSNIIYMQIYEKLREYCIKNTQFGSLLSTLTASIVGRTLVTSLNVPIQSLRIRISNEVKEKKLNFHGFRVTLIRDITYSGLFWSSFQYYRNYTTDGEYRANLSKSSVFTWKNFTVNLVPGFIITSIMSAITTPFDTLKTRIQSQGITSYKIIKGIEQIYKNEGLTGLFAGVQWRVLKNSIHGSLYLFIYEWYMQSINSSDVFDSNIQQ